MFATIKLQLIYALPKTRKDVLSLKKLALLCLMLCLCISCFSLTSFAQPMLDAPSASAAQALGMTIQNDNAAKSFALASNQGDVITTYAYRMGGASGMNFISLALGIVFVLLVCLFVVAAIKIIKVCNLYLTLHKNDSDLKM